MTIEPLVIASGSEAIQGGARGTGLPQTFGHRNDDAM